MKIVLDYKLVEKEGRCSGKLSLLNTATSLKKNPRTKMAEPHSPLPSQGASGVKEDRTATTACLCGAVQLSFVSRLGTAFRQRQTLIAKSKFIQCATDEVNKEGIKKRYITFYY
jgi:hypothetical protein